MKRNSNLSQEIQEWLNLYDHLARLRNLLDSYKKIKIFFENNPEKLKKYNGFCAVLFDSFSKNIIVTFGLFFDKTKGVQSLYKLSGANTKEVKEFEQKSKKYIDYRHNFSAHLSKGVGFDHTFQILSLDDIDEIYDLTVQVENILKGISDRNNYRHVHLGSFLGVIGSVDRFLIDFSKVS